MEDNDYLDVFRKALERIEKQETLIQGFKEIPYALKFVRSLTSLNPEEFRVVVYMINGVIPVESVTPDQQKLFDKFLDSAGGVDNLKEFIKLVKDYQDRSV